MGDIIPEVKSSKTLNQRVVREVMVQLPKCSNSQQGVAITNAN